MPKTKKPPSPNYSGHEPQPTDCKHCGKHCASKAKLQKHKKTCPVLAAIAELEGEG